MDFPIQVSASVTGHLSPQAFITITRHVLHVSWCAIGVIRDTKLYLQPQKGNLIVKPRCSPPPPSHIQMFTLSCRSSFVYVVNKPDDVGHLFRLD